MINYGEYELKDIPDRNEFSLDGLRIAFHKKEMNSALEFCKNVKNKGYKVYI